MKRKHVETYIARRLSEVLAPLGFRRTKGEPGLVRAIEGGRQEVGCGVYDYHPTFAFSLVVAIRLEAAVEILNRYVDVPPKYREMQTTTLTQLEYLTGGKRSRYEITTEEELAGAMDDLCQIVRDRVIPFVDKYKDVKSVDAAISAGGQPPFDSTQLPWGGMTRLIIARLANNPAFEAMVAQTEKLMRGRPEEEIFHRLVQDLKAR